MAIFSTRSYDQGIWKQVCICLKEFHHIFLSRYIGVNDIYYYAKLHKILRKRNTFQDPISFFQNHTFPSHKILTVVKENPQRYCATTCVRSGMNQIWIFKMSKEVSVNGKSQIFTNHTIKTYDLSTFYTTIPYAK